MRIVYGLIDPRDEPRLSSVRYVGMTERPETRVSRHIGQARSGRHHRANWIRSLVAEGLRPEMIVLEVVSDTADLAVAEVRWIYRLRTTNDLVNATCGGTGGSTRVGPPWNKGLRTGPMDPEVVARRADRRRGISQGPLSAEHRAKLSASHRGVPHSPEHVANQAASLRRTLARRRVAGMEGLF